MFASRSGPQVRVALWVDISGMDVQRERFAQRVIAINLSRNPGLLWGVGPELRSGDRITVTYRERKAPFQVVWTLEENAIGAQVAIHRLAQEPCPGKEALPAAPAVGD